MENRFSLTLKQIVLLILGVILVSASCALIIFVLGQQSAMRMIGFAPKETMTPTMPPLPQAMTATPQDTGEELYILEEEAVNQILAGQFNESSPIALQQVRFTREQVVLSGKINYLDYQGQVELAGVPVAQNGALHFQLSSVTVDGAMLPQMIYPTVEEQIDTAFGQMVSGYDIQSVELGEGQMTVVVIPW